ncbi:MAG: sigma-70 family RNA polymerase sigma factor, partial [Planctomycetota bacterium]
RRRANALRRASPLTQATAQPDTETPPAEPCPLTRVARNEPDAVAQCLDAYGPLVWALARRRLGPGPEAEDAVQDIFIDLWKSAPRYDPARAADTTFVATIARRRLTDRLRKLARTPDTATPPPPPPPLPGPADRAAQDEDARAAHQAVAQLPEPQQQAMRLAILDGHSHAEVAKRLGLPLGTVKSHIRRGLQKVRAALRPAKPATPGPAGDRHE